jgi:hypothetical protein
MRQLPKLDRGVIAAVSALAWFTISNHCALAAFETIPVVGVHSACHGANPNQPTTPGKNDETPCCKVLRATLAKTESPIGANSASFAFQPYFVGPAVFAEQIHPPVSFELDTGPPFSGSFAETVLQRSILAHAPPFLV